METNTANIENPEGKIAVIGMACRLPGASNIYEFWDNLVNGVESITTFTDDELRAAGVDEELIKSPNYVKSRGVIGGAEYFDASFFGFTPRDAELLDPQQRIFLECAWHALEDGGCDPANTEYRIGVFGGTGTPWHLVNVSANPEIKRIASGTSIVTSNDKDYLTTRVSYKLNLSGPSVSVQCACSTSLVAVVLGMKSLQNYECDMVLAGGATIELPERTGYVYQEGGLESPDGHCRTFDKSANGTVFSRGCGVVLLKRFTDAVNDGDNIYAVLCGGAINNDGNKKVGFTAPSVEGQIEVAVEALELSGINPDTITYVEAHGTATNLGDPIEVSSLTQTFRQYTERKQFCALGSVKTNIGHTDIAAGVSALIKTALSLKHGKIPPSLNYFEPNPKIDFENSPFFVNTSLREWEADGAPRRTLINSFGVGGTNACVIAEEPPKIINRKREVRKHELLAYSAKSNTALSEGFANIKYFLENHPNAEPAELAYSLLTGRRQFEKSGYIVYGSREELLEKLSKPESLKIIDAGAPNRRVVFMFPGQGNQYVDMGKSLYESEPVFKETVDKCSDYLKSEFGFDLRNVLYPSDLERDEALEKINQTYITQPALFAISYAAAQLLMSWGLKPDAMMGHSVGEYVAACISGVFSLHDALRAVAKRGAMIQSLPGGSMLAVLLTEETIAPYLNENLEISGVNSPGLTVLSGPDSAIDELEQTLKTKRIFAKRLSTSHAFHSAMMDPMLSDFSIFFEGISLNAPKIPIVSTVTGKWLTAEQAMDKNYWVMHVRKPVRFSDAVMFSLADEPAVYIEVGPGQSLESAVKRHLDKSSKSSSVNTMRTPAESINDIEYITNAIGNLWAAGTSPDWNLYYRGRNLRKISAPGYPFERQAYAIDFSKNKIANAAKKNDKKTDIGEWFYIPGWKTSPPIELLAMSDKKNGSEDNAENCWLVFSDHIGIGSNAVQLLRQNGRTAYEIIMGRVFDISNGNKITINADNREDYQKLLDHLKAFGAKPNRVLFLWNLDYDGLISVKPDTARAETDKNFFRPLYLQQAFINANLLDGLRIVFAGNNSLDVAGEPPLYPEKTLAVGPCRVFSKEFPLAQARYIDIEVVETHKQTVKTAKDLILEAGFNSEECIAAYRKGKRWTEDFNPIYINGSEQSNFRLTENGVYIITGGLGGLGLRLALFIAGKVKAKFVLTYFSTLPERKDWEQWLATHLTNDAISEKIKGILALESEGSEVMLCRADVTNYDEMRKVKEDAEKRFGKINGVIHSAGIAGGGIISLKTYEMASETLDSKVLGSVILDSLFNDSSLDFMLLFSSITAILGETGRVDYCAANTFMDYFAKARNARFGNNAISINWGQWGEIGMAARWEESQEKAKQRRIAKADLSNRELFDLLEDRENVKIYSINLNPETDWIIASHMLFGIPTAVGTSFVDMLYKLCLKIFPDIRTEFENVQFVSPLMFEGGLEKKVRVYIENYAGGLKFSFKSQPTSKDSGKDFWQEHIKGEIKQGGDISQETIDVGKLHSRFEERIDKEPIFTTIKNEDGSPLLEFGDRWKCHTLSRPGDKEWISELELPEEFAEDFEKYPIHPAMLDVSAMPAFRYITTNMYLPFGYKQISINSPLKKKIFSHCRLVGEFGGADETVSFDVTIYDERGNVLLEIQKYTFKKAGGKALQTSNKTKPAVTQKKSERYGNPKDILPDEGAEAFARILAAPFIEQVVICTSDLHELIIENLPSQKKLKKAEEVKEKQGGKAYARPNISTEFAEPENEIELAIANIWQEILGIEKIGANDNFNELGGNSLLAIQTVANIAETFQIELPAEAFFNNPTVRGLSETVLGMLLAMAGDEELDELIDSLEDN